MDHFGKKVDEFQVTNGEVRECVRAFDASISVKSNKVDLQIMKEQLNTDYLHANKWDEIEQMGSKLKEAVEASDASLKDQF